MGIEKGAEFSCVSRKTNRMYEKRNRRMNYENLKKIKLNKLVKGIFNTIT